MNDNIKALILNYVFLLGIILVLLVGIFLTTYYFKYTQNECLKEPFVYGINQLEETYGQKAYGSVSIIGVPGMFYFNSNNLTFVDHSSRKININFSSK